MNRQELVELLLKDKNAGFESKAAADRALKAVINGISEAIKKDGSLQLVGFGTFSVRSRPARKGRNPLTGEEIKIKASKNVGFKAGATLKAVAAKAKVK
ncbi:MAG: HU family DNA-binding protein [Spirochaetes bacterium]|jgi:DNA-binding protein HU-beta|nr:HU family DNA-binding protein [Spirochaetota bacterium]